MQRRRELMAMQNRLLPRGYTQVKYVESNGNAYIKTGLLPFDGIGFDVTFLSKSAISGGSGYGAIFGGRLRSKENDFQLTTYASNMTTFPTGTLRYGNVDYQAGIIPQTKQQIKLYGHTLTRPDGTTVTINAFNFNNTCQIALFLLNQNDSKFYQGGKGCRIYDLKFFDANGTKIKHYIPCYRNSDKKAGMYEIVTGEFLSSPATEQLIIPPT